MGERNADALKLVSAYLPESARREMERAVKGARVTNLRLRASRRPMASWHGGEAEFGEALSPEALAHCVSAMLEHSLYAWEDELGQGYFTLLGGSRAGVSGRYGAENGRARLLQIGSVCVRVAREVPGCASEIVRRIAEDGAIRSALILSPPGMGKTTMLRDAARQLSERKFHIAIADERGEIAACRFGAPTLDVGARTDVADGLPKSEAMPRLIRSMAPDAVVADEIGDARDALAVREAARMGVAVLTSAHARSLEDAQARPMLARALGEGVFSRVFVLGGEPGGIAKMYSRSEEGDGAWRSD